MPRVIGIDIPDNKRLVISLMYIYGIGKTLSIDICRQLNLDENMRAHKLSQDDIARLNALLQTSYVVEGDLRRQVQNNIKRFVNIHCYKGLRHRLGLPVHGQRTRTNSRTRKGKRKTVANKKS
jgi:small subunit ribosomal protein S13